MNPLSLLLVFTLSIAAGGCAAPPRQATPLPALPTTWSSPAARGLDADAPADAKWWEAFGDETLRGLLARATSSNPDLSAAAARVREARALAGIAEADRGPTIDAGGGVSKSRRSGETDDGRLGDRSSRLVQAGFDASWELDLFGRTEAAADAALADAAAAEADRGAALVSLRAEVARSYVSLRGAQRLRDVLRASATSAATTADLTRSRVKAGLATDLDLSRAEAQRADVEAEIPSVQATVETEIHRLSILCGEPPAALAPLLETPKAPPVAPPKVALGTPADVIARRPDLRRAALRVHAEEARAGVARAELYPRVTLASAFGLEADRPGRLGPGAGAWSFGPSIQWPIFDGGRSRGNVHAADARLDAARESHRAALLAALGEVEDALAEYLRGWERRDRLLESVLLRRRAVSLAADQHRAGLVGFLDVLDSERSLHAAEADLTRTETRTTTRLVALYKALGGGSQD